MPKVRPSLTSRRLHRVLTLRCTGAESYKHVATIGTLSDAVLLVIFDFYQKDPSNIWEYYWHRLARVCHRWREIVFASPVRLHIEILCSFSTSVKKGLDIWPAFPIVINYPLCLPRYAEDDVIVALKHLNRVCKVSFTVTGSQLGTIAALMEEPFPVLRYVRISPLSKDEDMPALPAEFLGGSAPRLETFSLDRIPFPALPTLLLSASGLTTLCLKNIPSNGYISPEALVTCLATLSRLKILGFGFQSASSRPDQIHPLPATRANLPVLTSFEFRGASEYLEDLVCRIDCPYLQGIFIFYISHQPVDFQTPQLSDFIDRSLGPKFAKCTYAQVTFRNAQVKFEFLNGANKAGPYWPSTTTISCSYEENDWPDSHISQVVSQFPVTFSDVVHLELVGDPYAEEFQFGDQEAGWFHLLRSFSNVKTLLVYRVLSGQVSLALENFSGEMVNAVLPSLELFCLDSQREHPVEKFVAARHSDRPVTVVNTITEFCEKLASYSNDCPGPFIRGGPLTSTPIIFRSHLPYNL